MKVQKSILLCFALCVLPLGSVFAGDHYPSLSYQVANYSSYPISWGFLAGGYYVAGPTTVNYQGSESIVSTDPQYGILPAALGNQPNTASFSIVARFNYSKSLFHRTCKAGNWAMVIASGVNTTFVDFTGHVPCSNSSNYVSVSGSGAKLPSPIDAVLNDKNKNRALIVCGHSQRYGGAGMASASPGSIYTISVYNLVDMPSCPN